MSVSRRPTDSFALQVMLGLCLIWGVQQVAASDLPADDAALAQRLIREAGVASIPVSAFYASEPETGYLRLCFAKRDETLDRAVERLAAFRV